MTKPVWTARIAAFGLLVFVLMTSIPSAQTPDKDDKTAPSPEAADPAAHFYTTTKMAPASLKLGDMEKAKEVALDLLAQSENWKTNWNYGNAIHVANLVLGHVALAAGNIDDAKAYLIKAGKTPGSPQLDSFGPNMRLAQMLLAKGETDVVLEYLDLCSDFWSSKFSKTDAWKNTIKNGKTPNFGANLVYEGF